jgi:hypothetical protein
MADLEVPLGIDQLKKNPYIVFDDNDKIVLSPEQQAEITRYWNYNRKNPPSISDIIQHIYKQDYDVRSKVGLVVRKFLQEQALLIDKKSKEVFLTDAQKSYIIENAKTMPPLKLAEQLFPDINITPLHNEFKVVNAFIKAQDPKVLGIDPEEETISDYAPPKHHQQAAARVNKYTYDSTVKEKEWERNTTIKNYLESLIKFCHHPRFLLLASRYLNKRERELFEGSFVAYVWDKMDLSKEEIDLYIDVCQDIVAELKLAQELEHYSQLLEDSGNDADSKKISVSIGEHIHNVREEINKNKIRRQKAIENLQGKRSERIEARRQENDSLLHLVDYIKTQENRARAIKTLEVRQKKLIDETKRLENMDDLIVEIYGISAEEIVFGKV